MRQATCILLVIAFISMVSSFTGTARHGFRRTTLQMNSDRLVTSAASALELPSKWGMMLADGLDADTLGALGSVDENIDMKGIVESASTNPATSILLKLSGSPLIVLVPIGAGVLVALALAFGISGYSNGKGD